MAKEVRLLHLVQIVKDDDALRESLTETVCALGYVAEGFGAVSQFFETFARRPAASVVLDCEMPSLRGLDILSLLRFDGFESPVILVSERIPEPNLETEVARLNGGPVLYQPFLPQQLCDAVSKAIDRI